VGQLTRPDSSPEGLVELHILTLATISCADGEPSWPIVFHKPCHSKFVSLEELAVSIGNGRC
jgi:hypothetical protein